MMIKFSWRKINNKFGWNGYSVLEYFYLKQKIAFPPFLIKKPSKFVIQEANKPYIKGDCFLVNPNSVLLNTKSPHELYTYLELASKRSIFDYKMRGALHLPLLLVPEYMLSWVKTNPMLKVENGNVYFRYEQE